MFDPYHDFKARETVQAQGIIQQVKDFVGPDLRSRVSLAALGNSLDFFIFKAKCAPIEDDVKAPADSFQALWRAP